MQQNIDSKLGGQSSQGIQNPSLRQQIPSNSSDQLYQQYPDYHQQGQIIDQYQQQQMPRQQQQYYEQPQPQQMNLGNQQQYYEDRQIGQYKNQSYQQPYQEQNQYYEEEPADQYYYQQQKQDEINLGQMFNPKQQILQQQKEMALFKVPPIATNSLYVDGIPIDASSREVSHIFRPFPGFIEVRLIQKTSKQNKPYYLCFVDFENPLQSTIAMQTLKGYRFDKNDKVGLNICFATNPKNQAGGQGQPPQNDQKRRQRR